MSSCGRLDSRHVDRRWFLRAAGTSAIAGLGHSTSLSAGLASSQAIWNQNSESPASHPYPGDTSADVWVFAGQSNSQGWGMLKAPVEPDPRILFFNSDNKWVVATEPLNPRFTSWVPHSVRENIQLQRTGIAYPGGPPTTRFLDEMEREKVIPGGVGPGLAFAKHLIQDLNRPLGLIYCGVGGSPIRSWRPGSDASYYDAMIRRLRMVGGRIKGLVWYQGESDAMTEAGEEGYEAALLQIIDTLRKDLNQPELPVLCVQLARFVWNYPSHDRTFEKIREIQRRLPDSRSHVYTVPALDLPLEDAAHLSFEGQQRLGKRVAEIALNRVYDFADHARGICLQSIGVLKPDSRRPMVRVRFAGVSGKLTAGGLPTGFEFRAPLPAEEPKAPVADAPMHTIYRVDFDPEDGAAIILGIFDNALINSGGAKHHPLPRSFSIVYGPGASPYVNIVDEKDMSLPAFGPVEVHV
jgi:sialate O-acetylesterase